MGRRIYSKKKMPQSFFTARQSLKRRNGLVKNGTGFVAVWSIYKEILCNFDILMLFDVKIGFAPTTLSHRLLVRSASLSPLATSTL